MALQPLPGFRSLITHHCVTGSMRHIYEFHGYPISEEMLLGLGEGVGFVYWHMKGAPPMYGGRANVGRPGEEGLEKAAGRRTGVRAESFSTASASRAEKAMLDLLARGEPVMLTVDMGYLPYFDLPKGFHFGGHVVVAAGVDLETRQVLIADRDEPLHPVSLEDVARARGSQFKPFPPRHTWHTFDFSQQREPAPAEVREAVARVAVGMLEPPIANLGVKGIRKAASATLEWPRLMSQGEHVYDICLLPSAGYSPEAIDAVAHRLTDPVWMSENTVGMPPRHYSRLDEGPAGAREGTWTN